MKKLFFLISICVLGVCPGYGKNFTVVYTGNSYASLYDCGHCPSSVGGALARRATVLKKLREENSCIAVVDAGNFTAGGKFDELSVNSDLDKKRTRTYLEALEKIGYDALCVGDEDLNFGQQFMSENASKYRLNFLSANAEVEGVQGYVIKKYGEIEAAFIGLTNRVASERLGRAPLNYKEILRKIVVQVKDKVDVCVLLSNMGDRVNKEIAQEFDEIKLIISSGDMRSSKPYENVGDTLICYPSYQAKDLRVIHFIIDDKKIVDRKFERVGLGKEVEEDEEVKNIVPVCFGERECFLKDKGKASCQCPGTLKASCRYNDLSVIKVRVITDTKCEACSTKYTEEFLKKYMPQITFDVFDYCQDRGERLLEKYGVETLPVFIFDRDIEEEKSFDMGFVRYLDKKDDSYLLKRDVSGVFMFLKREVMPGRLDVFVNVYDFDAADMLKNLDELEKEAGISVKFHFVPSRDEKREGNSEKTREAEEIERMNAVRTKYPDKFRAYLSRRISNISGTWWIDLFEELGIDYKEIKKEIQREDFASSMEEDGRLCQELGVTGGTAILVGNRFLFKVFRLDKKELLSFLDYVSAFKKNSMGDLADNSD